MIAARVVLVLLIAAAAATCDIPPAPRPLFWERFGPFDLEVERFDSLLEMMAASDAVVVASVRDVEVGRILQGDAPLDRVPYIRVELVVEQVIVGDAPAIVPLEFLVLGTPEQAAALEVMLKGGVPDVSGVFFLHEKQGAGEAGLYRVANSTGLWTPTSRANLDTPLREQPPLSAGLYADELVDIDELSELIDLLGRFAA